MPADPSPTAEQACELAIAQAMCAFDGLDWDEARKPSGPDGETEADVYAGLAIEALAALFRPGEKDCETCGGRGHMPHKKDQAGLKIFTPPPCPNPVCSSGRVPTPPPILALVVERLPAELIETLIGQGVLTRAIELSHNGREYPPDRNVTIKGDGPLYRMVPPVQESK